MPPIIINLTSNNDDFTGTSANEDIYGLAGNDTLRTGGGWIDGLYGGAGDDTLINNGSDQAVLFGGDDNDTLIGGDDQWDWLQGDDGNDILDGGGSFDSVYGGAGNDRIIIRDGHEPDEIFGGANTDILDLSDWTSSGFSVDLAAQTYDPKASTWVLGPYSVQDVENVAGTQVNDTIKGDGLANVLKGWAGKDTLNGRGGNDTLIGGKGNDKLTGGAGNDIFKFKPGDGHDKITDFNGAEDSLDFSAFSAADQALLASPALNAKSELVYSAGSFSVTLAKAPIYVTTTEDVVDASDGLISLREAILLANDSKSPTTIELGAGVYKLTKDGTSTAKVDKLERTEAKKALDGLLLDKETNAALGDLDITADITLKGTGAGATTIQNKMLVRAFQVEADGKLSIEDLKIDGAALSGNKLKAQNGGAILNNGGDVSVNRVTIANHELDDTRYEAGRDSSKSNLYYSASSGGAIFNKSGALDIQDSVFSGNKAMFGGALSAKDGQISIDASQFDSNKVYHSADEIDPGSKSSTSGAIFFGKGSAIFSNAAAKINITTNDAGTGSDTDFTNNTSGKDHGGQLASGAALIKGPVYLENAIDVTGKGNDPETLAGVDRTTPHVFAAPDSAPEFSMEEHVVTSRAVAKSSPAFASGSDAVLRLKSGTDLSLNQLHKSDLALVDNGILVETSTKIVIQMAGMRIMLEGSGLSFDGDPFDLTAAERAIAAHGTINQVTLKSVDGSLTLGTIKGLSVAFKDVVLELLEYDPVDPPSVADLLGVRLKQFGSANADVLVGTAGGDRIDGKGGSDTIDGAGGSDVLFGGLGNDVLDARQGSGRDILDGGGGADTMLGGSGKTIYFVDHKNDVIREYGSDKNDEVRTKISYTLGNSKPNGVDNVENLTLLGRGNIGGTGNDLNNLIQGNKGSNILAGGKGNDTLRGKAGADVFVFGKFGIGVNKDTIKDFKDNTDTIRLDDALWNGTLGKQQVLDKFAKAVAGNVVLDFGATEVKINNLSSVNALLDDLVIV